MYAVHYADEPDRKHIVEVKTHKDLDDKIGGDTYSFSKDEVIRYIESIDHRRTFCTIYKNQEGNWNKGKQVIADPVGQEKYIKTEHNGIKADNLGNLSTY
ncbi:hypothetical protein ATX69_09300 [Oenococcus oeni]|nr:hypothetical protein AAX21_05665 [Oenococcus oeni]KMQ40230.1 hypothetical protein AAX22_06930 [Oenococcus oeni]OIL19435.1 hypothetical protein ATW99_07520 [Oenococcus oeni]OIL21806.1 hypothetical protein ATX01_10095 [Oenococcus oeni]OIL41303.1 hypothetical protein ATX13_07440 [Oenococcus oeni]